MNAQQLYRKFDSKFHSAIWLNEKEELVDENEIKWYLCGIQDEFKKEVVNKAIEDFFSEQKLYLIITSGKSSLVPKSGITEEIGTYIHKKEIGLMNESLTKIMFFSTIGVFKKGVINEFSKTRIKPKGQLLDVSLHANIYNSETKIAAKLLQEPFEKLSNVLSNDYNGNIEHLWIDLELIESDLVERKKWAFRFQKRVSIPTSFKENYSYNVGHYSVKPDFEKLKQLTADEICNYILQLVYNSTKTLSTNKKKLEDFNVEQFRHDFLTACTNMGYSLTETH